MTPLSRPRRCAVRLPVLAVGVAAALFGLTLYNRIRAREGVSAPAPGDFIDVDGIGLHFLDRGQGMPLVLLHGNGSSLEDFDSSGIVDRTALTYRVIALDRPGFGRSPYAGFAWQGPSAQADLVHAALATMGVRRFLVLGHSWGTLAALQLALRHRDSVAGLVLVSGYYYPRVRPDLLLATVPASPILGTILRNSVLPPLVRLLWPAAMRTIFHPFAVPADFSHRMRELAARPSQLKSIALESAFLVRDALARLSYAGLAVPTGIVAGADDRLIDAPAQALRLHREIEGSILEILDAGHMAHHAFPEAIVRMIDQVAAAAALRERPSSPSKNTTQ